MPCTVFVADMKLILTVPDVPLRFLIIGVEFTQTTDGLLAALITKDE
jgi:hypothetical protein